MVYLLFKEHYVQDSGIKLQKKKNLTSQTYIYTKGEKYPAILSLVEKKWIQQAFNDYFTKNKTILYFTSNSNHIKPADSLNIKYVYFKLKGEISISLKADFVGLTEDNPSEFRLPGNENKIAKYYYGFKKPVWLKKRIDLSDLEYFKSGKNLRTDVPGACIIVDPFPFEEVQ